MNWKNLKDELCPYCNQKLIVDEFIESEIKCTCCKFHIDKVKYIKIIHHRGDPEKEIKVRMKWQNLHDSKCPMCSNPLYPTIYQVPGKHDTLDCLNDGCNFHILEDKFQQILLDPNHPANRFNKNG